ncbi:RidA family protein [Leifsonia sp. EB34]|uniref:RidA family protein n=1 Tax=Leifsonia sp. EB34 TaxID=3156303 RepID=UPI003519A8FA
MSKITLIRSDVLAATPGYAYASVLGAGTRLIHLAGACPLDADGVVAPIGDYAGQTVRCIENLIAALSAAGGSLSDVAYTRILVVSSRREDLGAVWDVVRAEFAGHEAPSTLLGVTALGYENQLVEIEAVAAAAG